MARNGTVCQAGSSRIAARLSPTNPTQAMSSQDRRGQRRTRWAARTASPGRVPPRRVSADPGPSDRGSARSAPGRPAEGPPLAPSAGEPASAGAAWGEPAMVERAMGATRHLGGTRLIRRCVYTVSPHLARVRAHSACRAAPAPTQLPSGLPGPPLSVSLQRMRVNAGTTPRSGNPAFQMTFGRLRPLPLTGYLPPALTIQV